MNERVNNIKTTLILMIIEANTLPSSRLAPVLDTEVRVEKNQTGKFAFLASQYFQEQKGHAVTDEGYYTISYVKEVYDWLYKEALELKAKRNRETQEKPVKIPEKTNDLDLKNIILEAINKKMAAIIAERKNPPADISDLTSKKTSNGARVLAKDYEIYEELIKAKTLVDNLKDLEDLKYISSDLILSLDLDQKVVEKLAKINNELIKEEKPPVLVRKKLDTEIHAPVANVVEKAPKIEAVELAQTGLQAAENVELSGDKNEGLKTELLDSEIEFLDVEPTQIDAQIHAEASKTDILEEPKIKQEPAKKLEKVPTIDMDTLKVANAIRRVIDCLNKSQVKFLEETTLTSRLEAYAQEYLENQKEKLNPEFAREVANILTLDAASDNDLVERNLGFNPTLERLIEQDTSKTIDAFRKATNYLSSGESRDKNFDLADKFGDLAREYLDSRKDYLNPEVVEVFAQMMQYDEAQHHEATQVVVDEAIVDDPKLELDTLKVVNTFRKLADLLNKPQVKYLEETTLTSRLEKAAQEYLNNRAKYLRPELLEMLQDLVTTNAQNVTITSTLEEEQKDLVKLESPSKTQEEVEIETLQVAKEFRKLAESLNKPQVKYLEETTLTSRLENIAYDYLNSRSDVVDPEILKELKKIMAIDNLPINAEKHAAEEIRSIDKSSAKVDSDALKIAKYFRRVANNLVKNQVLELEEVTQTAREEQLELARNLRKVANYLNNMPLALEERTQTSRQAQNETVKNLEQVVEYLNNPQVEAIVVDNSETQKQQYEDILRLLEELVNKHGLYVPKAKYSDLTSYLKIPQISSTIEHEENYQRLEQGLIAVDSETAEIAVSSTETSIAVVDEASDYLEENRETIKEITKRLKDLDSKDQQNGTREILECLLIILKNANLDSHLMDIDNLKIRISDVSSYYRLKDLLEQDQINKNTSKELSVYQEDKTGKELYNPKHLKPSVRKSKTRKSRRKVKMLEPLKNFVTNYWKQSLCGLLAGATILAGIHGIGKSFNNKNKMVHPERKGSYSTFSDVDFEHVIKYPFGTVNNIYGDYATDDYYLINLKCTVYLTTRSLNNDTGYLEYYDARDNTTLIGKYFIGSILKPEVQEDTRFKMVNGYGGLIIDEAVVPLKDVLPYKFFSDIEFKWFTSNSETLHKMLTYSNKDVTLEETFSSLGARDKAIESKKLLEFDLRASSLFNRKVVGYRLSEDVDNSDYCVIYDVITGNYYNIKDVYNVGFIEIKELDNSMYTVEQLEELVKDDTISQENILVLNVKANKDVFASIKNAQETYYLVFIGFNNQGDLIYKDLYNDRAEMVISQDYKNLVYIDKDNEVELRVKDGIDVNDVVISVNDFFRLHGFTPYVDIYTKDSLINSIDVFNSYMSTISLGEGATTTIEGAISAKEILIFDTTSESVNMVIDMNKVTLEDVQNGTNLESNMTLDYESGRHKKYYFLKYVGSNLEEQYLNYVDIFDEYVNATVGDQLNWANLQSGSDIISANNIILNDGTDNLDMAVKSINVFLKEKGLGDLARDYYTMGDLIKLYEYFNANNMTRKLS